MDNKTKIIAELNHEIDKFENETLPAIMRSIDLDKSSTLIVNELIKQLQNNIK